MKSLVNFIQESFRVESKSKCDIDFNFVGPENHGMNARETKQLSDCLISRYVMGGEQYSSIFGDIYQDGSKYELTCRTRDGDSYDVQMVMKGQKPEIIVNGHKIKLSRDFDDSLERFADRYGLKEYGLIAQVCKEVGLYFHD